MIDRALEQHGAVTRELTKLYDGIVYPNAFRPIAPSRREHVTTNFDAVLENSLLTVAKRLTDVQELKFRAPAMRGARCRPTRPSSRHQPEVFNGS